MLIAPNISFSCSWQSSGSRTDAHLKQPISEAFRVRFGLGDLQKDLEEHQPAATHNLGLEAFDGDRPLTHPQPMVGNQRRA